jgi:uncharacterized protein
MKKVIVISGGSDGLGKTIAENLAPDHQVIILALNKNKMAKLAKDIKVDFEVCDVSNYKQCQSAIKNVIKKHKRIDCLINNAGIWIEGELDENNPDHIQKTLDVNTVGTIFLTKATIPYLKKQKSGYIINVISQAGLYAKALRTTYYASKWALVGFTKCLMQEMTPYSIRVTGFYPGKMKTHLFDKVKVKKDLHNALETEPAAKSIRYLLTTDETTVIPELGIKHINN